MYTFATDLHSKSLQITLSEGFFQDVSLPEAEQTVILMVRPSWFYTFIFGMAGLVNFMFQRPCFHTL